MKGHIQMTTSKQGSIQAPQGATTRKPTPSASELNKCAVEGLSTAQTARKLNYNYQAVRRAAIKFGVVLEYKPREPTKREAVLDALLHVDIEELAKKAGCTQSYVWKIVAEIKQALDKDGPLV